MKKLIAIFALFAAFASCEDRAVEKPGKLIDEDVMVDIFYDLSLLEAMRSRGATEWQNAKDPNTYIYKKYGIDSLQFVQNNRYYATDIKRYKRMYGRVGKRLEALQKEMDSLDRPKPKGKLPDAGLVK